MNNQDNSLQQTQPKIKKTPKPLPILIKLMFWIFISWWYFLIAFFIAIQGTNSNGNELLWEWTIRFRLFGKNCRRIKREYLESQTKTQN